MEDSGSQRNRLYTKHSLHYQYKWCLVYSGLTVDILLQYLLHRVQKRTKASAQSSSIVNVSNMQCLWDGLARPDHPPPNRLGLVLYI